MWKLVVFCCLAVQVTRAVEVNSDLRCYVCSEVTSPECRNPFEPARVPSELCSSLDYPKLPREGGARKANDGQTPVGHPFLREVFSGDERFPPKMVYMFECIKFSTSEGVIRSCIPKPANIEDACEFFRKEKSEVKTCNSCTKDNCNGTVQIEKSVAMIIGLVLCTMIKIFE